MDTTTFMNSEKSLIELFIKCSPLKSFKDTKQNEKEILNEELEN